MIGSDVVIGDTRWAGAWGMSADFIAKTTCSILFVSVGDVMVIRERGRSRDRGRDSLRDRIRDIKTLYSACY